MKMIFLVDGDNHIGTGLQGIDLLTAEDSVLVFYGKGQTLANVKKMCAGSRAKIQYLESVKGGKNSIDFQIITELGVLVGRGEADFAYVISQDKGYEAAMSALNARYATTFQEVALRPSIQDCLQAAFLLRASSREELAAALAAKYGKIQGALTYQHIEALFTPAAPTVPTAKAEQKKANEPKKAQQAKKQPSEPKKQPQEPKQNAEPKQEPAKKAPSRRKRAAVKTAKPAEAVVIEAPTPAPVEETAEEKAKTASRTHRGGRRRKRPAQEKVAEQ